MKFKQDTLGWRIILKPYIQKESKGGIIFARSDREQAINTDKGEVYMVGPAAWYDKPEEVRPQLKPGDCVYYAKWSAKTLQDEETGEFYILCNDEDILVGYTDDPASTVELVEHGRYDQNDGRYISEGKKAEKVS